MSDVECGWCGEEPSRPLCCPECGKDGYMGCKGACADTITALQAENAGARSVLDRIDEIAKAADAAPLCMGEIRQLIAMHRAELEGE